MPKLLPLLKFTRQQAEQICRDVAFDHPTMADVTTHARLERAPSIRRRDVGLSAA